jgi:Mg-chelatase subunit ChlD
MTAEPETIPAAAAPVPDPERLRRWRLVLGGGEADGIGIGLGADDLGRDGALAALYSERDRDAAQDGKRSAGLGGSAPAISRWLGDIRRYFPTSTVSIMQRDALERLNLRQLLMEPELLSSFEPNVHLVSQLVSLSGAMPSETRETARQVIRTVVDQLEQRIAEKTRSAIAGAIARADVTRRPRARDIDWDRTIRKNLRHYQPEYRTVVPETLLGHGRRSTSLRDVIVAIDQSGSMAASVVYSSVFAAVMGSIRSVKTHLVAFDTEVADLSDQLSDPVDLLFGIQLGGGTDINRAVGYCQTLITRPSDTVFVLISDLYEGGVEEELLKRVASMVSAGVTVVVLLALADEGAAAFDRRLAAKLTALGAPSFACTPDLFPDLMGVAIARRDINAWAAEAGVTVAGTAKPEG